MQFEWDDQKRRNNLEKYGLDFFDVAEVFEAPHVVVPSKSASMEARFLAVGFCQGRCVTVVYTMRSEAMRIISFRRARHEEREKYYQLFGRGA